LNKLQVLILCTGNSARSQIAEGLLRHESGEHFEVHSAGTKPGIVRPEAIAVMRELGIDISNHRSKHLDEFAGQSFDFVLTLCDDAKQSCPIFSSSAKTIHHSFDDPASLDATEKERLAIFRRVRDEIRKFLRTFAAEQG
jgi:arsenate reductase (thioredoxin)